jgi:diguanylate cyclase (GGDEF)-like protein
MNAVSSSLPPTAVPRPANEAQRLAAVQRHAPFDGRDDPDLDFLTALAAELCGAAAAYVSLVDGERSWLRSAVGVPPGPVPRDEDLGAWSILEKDGLAIHDLAADPRTAAFASGTAWRMASTVNLAGADGLPVGALCVLDTRARTLGKRERDLLRGLARQAMATLELRAQRQHLAATLAAMETLATTDELTGLCNRRVLMERLEQELERVRRFGTPLTVVKTDLDHFGLINDEHGHAVGDEVLRNVGRLVRGYIRQLDIAGRYDGATLCLVLPGTPPAGGVEVANNLRQMIEGYVHRCCGAVLAVTASFGVAGLEAGTLGTAQDLLRSAEVALERAKEGGRNRVEL